jgi:hypothetical protein
LHKFVSKIHLENVHYLKSASSCIASQPMRNPGIENVFDIPPNEIPLLYTSHAGGSRVAGSSSSILPRRKGVYFSDLRNACPHTACHVPVHFVAEEVSASFAAQVDDLLELAPRGYEASRVVREVDDNKFRVGPHLRLQILQFAKDRSGNRFKIPWHQPRRIRNNPHAQLWLP